MAHQIDTDAKIITGPSYGFGHPAICRLSDIVMLAAHINQSDELEIHKSIDNGLNWTLKKTLSDASGCFNFAPMSSTKAGLVYQKNNNEFEVWVSIDSGENWTNKLDIPSYILEYHKAILMYDSGINRLHIIWDTSEYDNGIRGLYSDNDGDSWTSWYHYGRNRLYEAAINPVNHYIYASINHYYSSSYPNQIRWYNRDGDGIGSVDLSEANHTYSDRNIVCDSAGNRYFSYIDRNTTTSKEKLSVRRNEGSAITLFDPDTDNIIVKGSISIGVDEDDNVYIFYTKTTDEKTYYRKYDAGTTTWQSEVELITLANNRINTEKHVLAGSSKLHYVYYRQP